MFPTIDKKETGINIRRIMDERGITVKDVQEYLNLGSTQSVYHWLNGISMPSIDNLYALSELVCVPMDEIVCGNRKPITPDIEIDTPDLRTKQLYMYYEKLCAA